jgi:hypothetical protein
MRRDSVTQWKKEVCNRDSNGIPILILHHFHLLGHFGVGQSDQLWGFLRCWELSLVEESGLGGAGQESLNSPGAQLCFQSNSTAWVTPRIQVAVLGGHLPR